MREAIESRIKELEELLAETRADLRKPEIRKDAKVLGLVEMIFNELRGNLDGLRFALSLLDK